MLVLYPLLVNKVIDNLLQLYNGQYKEIWQIRKMVDLSRAANPK